MARAYASAHQISSSVAALCTPSASPFSKGQCLLPAQRVPCLSMPRLPFPTSSLCFSRRPRGSDRALPSSPATKKKKPKKETVPGDGSDEDAFEALFKQLEEDLKYDEGSFDDGDDEITEEELAMLEKELEEALGEDDDLVDLLNATRSNSDGVQGEEQVVEVDELEDEEEEEEPVKLKGWQLRRLAYALKAGRRKTNIKSLSAEVCLDRSVVLGLLRNPPPNLLMMSASLPEKPDPVNSVALSGNPDPVIPTLDPELVSSDVTADPSESEAKVKPPIHVLQASWSAQKRLKKVQVETLESVYRRTKRPTNAMVSSIIHVTNLPRKRVVKWFEDKRAEEGVPEQRRPYHRSTSEEVSLQ